MDIKWYDIRVGRQLFVIPTKEPSVSMNENGLVVAAAQTCDDNSKIVFRGGMLREYSNTIVWEDVDQAASNYMYGCSPVVAINKEKITSSRYIYHIISVHVHTSNFFGKLFMKHGVVDVDTKMIKWSEQGKPLEYGSGMYPSVTINSKGQVVKMHGANGSYDMFYEVGNLSYCEHV